MDVISLIHIVSAVVALFTGTLVLFLQKGSRTHVRTGYVYCISMIGVISTAFMIYELFGGWGMFHWAAVVSGLTLAAGMVPLLLRRPPGAYISLHLSFMYWSVMGLYAAFIAETMVRLPETDLIVMNNEVLPLFYSITTASLFLVMAVAGFVFYRKQPVWQARFQAPVPPES